MIWLSRLLRALAVAIAILAAIDPSIPLTRTDRPVVALIGTNDAAFTSRVANALDSGFDVHVGPIAGAAATVVAGHAVPDPSLVISGAVVAVTPPPSSPRIDIASVSAPATATSGASIPVTSELRLVGLAGRTVTIELFAGSLASDSASYAPKTDDDRTSITLALPPSGPGLLAARVMVRDAAATGARVAPSERTAIVDVRDAHWRVLVVDPRPSWTSTFVRRALEGDRRFEVVSRVETSTAISVQSGAAPSLTDHAALAGFDAVLVGAPDALEPSAVRSLERYARERGGAVVLLLDQVSHRALAPLLGGVALTDVHGVEKLKVVSRAGTLQASEFAVARGGAGLRPMATVTLNATEQAVIWQSPLGAGRVVVNGALDAWRNRAREDGSFARFWVDAISRAAEASPAPLVVDVSPRVAAPGTRVSVRAIVRDAQLSDPDQPAPTVSLTGPPELWASAERGVFVATFDAPDTPGNYELHVKGAGAGGDALDAVARYTVAVATDTHAQPDLLAAWAAAHGGTVVIDDGRDVAAALGTVVDPRSMRVPTRIMRSVWWLPAFVLLLGGEWWIRRRRGER